MDNLPPLRDVLSAHGIFAKKSFGQHFLLDLNLTDKIARLAAPHPHIIEVGPGPGGLTRSLISANAQHVTAVEKDDRFVPILGDIAARAEGKLTIIEADALKVDVAELGPERPLRICANLPYNVGTKLLINWLTAKPVFWDRMVLMLQKEVAERIAAKPSTKAYGRLAVLAQSIASAHISFDVPARAFTPPPKVDSAVIVLDLLAETEQFPDLKSLGIVTAAAFGQRRKMLRKSLRNLAEKHNIELGDWLERADIDGNLRPETIDIKGFYALTNAFIALQ